MDTQYKLSDISTKNIGDGKYKYEIDVEKISKSERYLNLGPKICVRHNGISGIQDIDRVELEKIDGSILRSKSWVRNCIVFNDIIYPSDTIRIFSHEDLDNYIIQFPEAWEIT